MPKPYVKKSDRVIRAAEEKALIILQNRCDSHDATDEAKQQAAQSILDFISSRERDRSKVEPLRKDLAERIKLHRAAQQECDRLAGELETAEAKLSELGTK